MRVDVNYVLLVAWACGTPQVASAQVIVLPTESAFLAAAGAVSRDTFDDVPRETVFGPGPLTRSGVTYTSTNPSGTWGAFSIFSGVSPPNFLGVNNDTTDTRRLTFGSGQPVEAVGLHLLVPNAPSPPILEITAVGAPGWTYTETIAMPPAANPSYRGFIAPGGVTSVSVRSLPSKSGVSNNGFDNVSHSTPVPEPNGLALCGVVATCFASRLARRLCRPKKASVVTG